MSDLSSFEIKWCRLCSVCEGMIFLAVKELFVKGFCEVFMDCVMYIYIYIYLNVYGTLVFF